MARIHWNLLLKLQNNRKHDYEPNEEEDENDKNNENDPAHLEDNPRDAPHPEGPGDYSGGTPQPGTPCMYTMQPTY